MKVVSTTLTGMVALTGSACSGQNQAEIRTADYHTGGQGPICGLKASYEMLYVKYPKLSEASVLGARSLGKLWRVRSTTARPHLTRLGHIYAAGLQKRIRVRRRPERAHSRDNRLLPPAGQLTSRIGSTKPDAR